MSGSILFCIYSHNVWGGIETWLHEILAAHREAGWTTTLAVARGKRFNDPQRFACAFGDTVVSFDGRTGTAEGRIAAIQGLLQKVRPSIVVPIGVGHALPAIGRAKLSGVPTRLALPLHAINAPLFEDVETFAAIVDLVVGVNRLQTSYLSRRYPSERLVVVPNGTRGAVTERSPRIPEQLLRLLFVGRVDQFSKRVFDATELAAELKRRGVPFRYTIAGDGPSLPELKARSSAEFAFLGYVPPDRLFADVFPAADILTVFSAAGEAFPLVMIEGMINGCIPVSSEWPGLWSAGHMKNGENGFAFAVGNIREAADAVERLWRQPEVLSTMSNKAMETGREFSWSQTRARWLHAMEELLTRAPLIDRSFPMRTPVASGRLDRLPFGAGEYLRRALRRYPDFEDGWGEWPGTLSGVRPQDEERLLTNLVQLDREARK